MGGKRIFLLKMKKLKNICMQMVEVDDQEKDHISSEWERRWSPEHKGKPTPWVGYGSPLLSISLGRKVDNTGPDTKKLVDLVVGR